MNRQNNKTFKREVQSRPIKQHSIKILNLFDFRFQNHLSRWQSPKFVLADEKQTADNTT